MARFRPTAGGPMGNCPADERNAVGPFLDGKLSPSDSEKTVAVINPSNGQRLMLIPSGCQSDVNRAVVSARRAFDDGRWHEAPPSVRKRILHKFADQIDAGSAHLDQLDAEEMGKPVSEPAANARAAAGLMRFYAEAIDKVGGSVYSSDNACLVTERRVPRGVVAAIVPWNFPTYVAILKAAPALAGGNCVVLKPSELSSRSAVHLAHLATEAGLPLGVLNVVPGSGETVGRALALHMDVDMLSFTGSTAVGKLMLSYSGQSNLKVVMLECGGKSPQIVFGDGVDLDRASESIARMILTNQGQLCSAGSRVLVQSSIETKFVEKIVSQMQRIVMGDALDPATTFGPLASSQQYARVLRYVDSARQSGAQLATGGIPAREESGGYFVEPTVFRNVSPTAQIAQEEIFGPVLSLIPFENEQDAISIANQTIYGLAAYVWTTSLARGMRVAKNVRSSVWLNATVQQGEGAGYAASYEPTAQSGIGTEGGLGGMESYMRRQLIWINHG